MSNTTSTYTYDEETYSDLHKDAYGFRPRGNAYAAWNAMTPAEKQAEWDRLCRVLENALAEEAEEEKRAVARFEALVASTVAMGAGDRETAVRWLVEASEAAAESGYRPDMDYFCFLNGLPYGYFGGPRNKSTGY